MWVCRQEAVSTAAQAVGSMWEAAAACDAIKGYIPLLVLEFLRARCSGVPGVLLLVYVRCVFLCMGGRHLSWQLNQR